MVIDVRLCPLSLAKLLRGKTLRLSKKPDQIFGVAEAATMGNLPDRQIGLHQQIADM
jgi:hypothetical protein